VSKQFQIIALLELTLLNENLRSCQSDTESDTEDGYFNRCGQLYDETHALETRECLLLGNHRYCICKYFVYLIDHLPISGNHFA
jgi:hypothetical protein